MALELEEFPHDTDFSLLVREKTVGSKLETALKKKRSRVISKTPHAFILLPQSFKSRQMFSKRDVAHVTSQRQFIGPTDQR